MKFTFDKEWLEKNAERDLDLEIAAGSFTLDQLPPADVGLDAPTTMAFGRLISLCRRKRAWSIEDLAASARIEVSEAVRIEQDATYIPGPRTVHQLATLLGLPAQRMLQLSGNMIVRDRRLGEQAVRFAARSESVRKLAPHEQTALEEFVRYLNEPK